jgi:hypothetical protein
VLILKFMLKEQGGIYLRRIGPFNTVKKNFYGFCKMANLSNTLVSRIDQFFDCTYWPVSSSEDIV